MFDDNNDNDGNAFLLGVLLGLRDSDRNNNNEPQGGIDPDDTYLIVTGISIFIAIILFGHAQPVGLIPYGIMNVIMVIAGGKKNDLAELNCVLITILSVIFIACLFALDNSIGKAQVAYIVEAITFIIGYIFFIAEFINAFCSED